jgi:hypothetical protein
VKRRLWVEETDENEFFEERPMPSSTYTPIMEMKEATDEHVLERCTVCNSYLCLSCDAEGLCAWCRNDKEIREEDEKAEQAVAAREAEAT